MNQKTLIVIGSVAALGAAYSIYAKVQQGRKDQLASALIRAIQKAIEPASSALAAEDAFDIHYTDQVLKKIPGQLYLLSLSETTKLANQIHSSFGSFWSGGDDEDQLYGIFRKLKDKVQVSQVAKAYYTRYKINLIDKLHDQLNNREVDVILGIVQELADYRKAI